LWFETDGILHSRFGKNGCITPATVLRAERHAEEPSCPIDRQGKRIGLLRQNHQGIHLGLDADPVDFRQDQSIPGRRTDDPDMKNAFRLRHRRGHFPESKQQDKQDGNLFYQSHNAT